MHGKVQITATQDAMVVVDGQQLRELPGDLYIPPDAMRVWLESFSGPLDLLLYLIRKQNIDILNIPVAHITTQYLQYIELMEIHRLELAAEYLLMAALLAQIKSRLLLPVLPCDENEDDDPRKVLVDKLKAYEAMQKAAQAMEALPRLERDFFVVDIQTPEYEKLKTQPDVDLLSLVDAMKHLLKQQDNQAHHTISREQLSVRERMSAILKQLQIKHSLMLEQLFKFEEGRSGLTVSLLAILELARESLLTIQQAQPFSAVHIHLKKEN